MKPISYREAVVQSTASTGPETPSSDEDVAQQRTPSESLELPSSDCHCAGDSNREVGMLELYQELPHLPPSAVQTDRLDPQTSTTARPD